MTPALSGSTAAGVPLHERDLDGWRWPKKRKSWANRALSHLSTNVRRLSKALWFMRCREPRWAAWDGFAMRNIGLPCNGAWNASSMAMLKKMRQGLHREDRPRVER